ncbi:pleckstrin homology domain-containing family S member 1-like isoform X2 [Hypomesus transpacificus]|uniref:pleckstrin homology domain-containing family S member 1-like isoform X2 n=1 Tax=Hypomesus transpacificus TaxID=137520 RepID=UPI001F07835E|nr:pleckstrin homology domain-containing family S member 1-like isoform X2 [Hypomesus transpacificus]
MPKSIQKSSVSNTVFYKPVEGVEEVRTGYLLKSPPPFPLKTKNSWKRRFFVLFKMKDESYLLKYFKSSEDREKPYGGIELSKISLFYLSPQKHIQWPRINKNFKCSPDCVLFIKARDREYFLIGEDSSDIDGWFWDIYEALKYRPHQMLNPEVLADDSSFTIESISDPVLRVFTLKKRAKCVKEDCKTQPVKDRSASEPNEAMAKSTESVKESQRSRRACSEPARNFMELSLYDYPKSFLRKASLGNEEVTCGPGPVTVEHAWRPLSEQVKEPGNNYYDYPRRFLNHTRQESEDEEAYEDDRHSYYMKMETVFEIMKEAGERDKDSLVQSFEVNAKVEEFTTDSLVRSVTQVFDKLKTQVPIEAEADPDERVDFLAASDSSPTENETGPPVVMTQSKHLEQHSSIERLNVFISKEEELLAEKDIIVNQEDLKKHLVVSDVEGKPCVFGWTGQSQTTYPFHKGDRILAINDLHTGSVEEFQTYLRRLLKEQVTLTILRLPGSEPMPSTFISNK